MAALIENIMATSFCECVDQILASRLIKFLEVNTIDCVKNT